MTSLFDEVGKIQKEISHVEDEILRTKADDTTQEMTEELRENGLSKSRD